MNKKVLITLFIVAALFSALFIIQIIDEKVNGEDYKMTRNFAHKINSVIKTDTACINNLGSIMQALNDDSLIKQNLNLDKTSLNKKITACYKLSNEIKDISIPKIKSQNKTALMNNLRENFSNTFSSSADIIKIYNNCEQRNSSCLDGYDLVFLDNLNNIQSELIIDSFSINMTYSVKDILVKRPLLMYLKYRLVKGKS